MYYPVVTLRIINVKQDHIHIYIPQSNDEMREIFNGRTLKCRQPKLKITSDAGDLNCLLFHMLFTNKTKLWHCVLLAYAYI